jgi:hypothetical protein
VGEDAAAEVGAEVLLDSLLGCRRHRGLGGEGLDEEALRGLEERVEKCVRGVSRGGGRRPALSDRWVQGRRKVPRTAQPERIGAHVSIPTALRRRAGRRNDGGQPTEWVRAEMDGFQRNH